jgi:4-hydroxy-4-methyl-2-oxoglutarate aldolase
MSAPADLLTLYKDLRVADVRDAMDVCMLHHVGSMDPAIRPLWRTRACGLARTVRYVPYDGAIPRLSPDEYDKWSGAYYRDICPYPWTNAIEDGDFIVIDQSGVDAGLMGSENTLGCLRRGARGFVTSGGVRDTDEIISQRVPFWSLFISQSMVQGRLRYDTCNIPVHVGGVLVHPGDVVVADGDGVIVVPRDCADDVALRAAEIHGADMRQRRAHYDALGLSPDETVLPEG